MPSACYINVFPVPDVPATDYMHAVVTAMFVLMVPAFLICAGIAIAAYRKREPPSPPG